MVRFVPSLLQHRANIQQGPALPWPKALIVEVRDDNNEWKVYTSDKTAADTDPLRVTETLRTFEREEPVIEVPCPAKHPTPHHQFEPLSSRHHPLGQKLLFPGTAGPLTLTPSDYHYVNFSTDTLEQFGIFTSAIHAFNAPVHPNASVLDASSMTPIWAASEPEIEYFHDMYDMLAPTGNQYRRYMLQESPLSQFWIALFTARTGDVFSGIQALVPHAGIGDVQELGTHALVRASPAGLVQALLHDATQVQVINSRNEVVPRLPDANEVVERLLSSLPECFHGGEILAKDDISDTPFYYALLYSMANGLAGLRDIPPGAILQTMRKHPEISSRILECLKSCPDAQATCLADNLFRAAVEACDEQAVVFVLQATLNSPNTIDPNDIVCQIGNIGRMYTPIELAAKFRHLGIVNILLTANADVNKTYDQTQYNDRGALECAIRKYGDYEPVDLRLVQTILHCGAEVRIGIMEASIRWGQVDVIQELIPRLHPSSHSQAFSGAMLTDAVRFLRNDSASYIILQLFAYCKSENCLQCSTRYQEKIAEILRIAAMKANNELVDFLLPHTIEKYGGLAGAIRGGSRRLIDLFLQYANSPEPACFLDLKPEARTRAFYDLDRPTTPLAEAIRTKDMSLVHEMETIGLLKHLVHANHFAAAVHAAAEAGNIQYLRKLFELVPRNRDRLASSLTLAIHQERTEVALFLIHNGADVNDIHDVSRYLPLYQALEKRNWQVVNAILETEVDVNFHLVGPGCMTALELAGSWGDMSVVQDLILMGAYIDDGHHATALSAAVKAKNTSLVTLLLKEGASPSAKASSGESPLTVAIINRDDDMIQTLLDAGATPADEEAFLAGLEHHRRGFDVLVQSFFSEFPNGKRGFGGDVLAEALERGDNNLLTTLLLAKFDVGSRLSKLRGSYVSEDVSEDEILLSALGFAIAYRKDAPENLHLVKLLIDHGDPNSIVFSRILQRDFIRSRKTALLLAVETSSEQIVTFLLEKGADINRPARRGLKRTPLQRACEIGSFKMVKLLVERGADVNQGPADHGGATALQLAAASGSIKIAGFLVSHGALVRAESAMVDGFTALEGAGENSCVEMINYLWHAVGGAFTTEEILSAKNRALKKGHRGCAEYIDVLASSTSFAGSGVMVNF
jgi:ankyrin repeat protein